MDAFLFYVDDWLGSTRIALMTPAEERGYLRLLLHSAKQPDCGLPNDPALLAKLSLLGSSWKNGSGRTVLACFYEKDGRLYNQRLLKVYHNHMERQDRRRKAAEKRWNPDPVLNGSCHELDSAKDGQSTCNADEMTHMPMPMPIPTLNLTTKDSIVASGSNGHGKAFFDAEHERWYRTAYWCHKSKQASRKAFEKRVLALSKARHETVEECIEFLHRMAKEYRERFAETRAWAWLVDLQPATWLNGERWEDEAGGDESAPVVRKLML
jgi:uncharacterized protein YdaU (DUF1376 family)